MILITLPFFEFRFVLSFPGHRSLTFTHESWSICHEVPVVCAITSTFSWMSILGTCELKPMLGSLLAALKSCSFGLIPGMIPTVLTGVFVFSYGAVVCFAPTLGDPHSYKSYFFLERTFKSSGSRISRNTLSFFLGISTAGDFAVEIQEFTKTTWGSWGFNQPWECVPTR